ncbi:BgTH12-05070 [Blumeria graminis f. sp. triticale]|uniref:BgTH12-05070 n=1 Tax=Blumeria graminis f. sp. triticale TaxID=1689686 RepID=A0A9W4GF70_BLUGR|nr:BgTH12-05070 [Blumeria graminis f. sp. triticale]
MPWLFRCLFHPDH